MLQENTQALSWWMFLCCQVPDDACLLTLELQETLENITSKQLFSHEDETYFNVEIWPREKRGTFFLDCFIDSCEEAEE